METTMLFRTALITAALLTFGIATAEADASAEVTFGDLNLAHPDDAKVLAGRLQAAAQQVCLSANPELEGKPEMQQCTDAAISMAIARIQSRMEDSVRAKLFTVRGQMTNPR